MPIRDPLIISRDPFLELYANCLILNQLVMKNQSLSILFVIKLNKQNKKGLCPLNVRITYLKKRKEISSGLMVNPSDWYSKYQKPLNNLFNLILYFLQNHCDTLSNTNTQTPIHIVQSAIFAFEFCIW